MSFAVDTSAPITTAALFAAVIGLATLASYVLARVIRSRKPKTVPLSYVSSTEKRYFDESEIRVDLCGLDVQQLTGLSMSHEQIVSLCGATTGASVKARLMSRQDWINEGTGADQPPPGLYFDVNGPLIDSRGKQTIGIFKDAQNIHRIYLKDILFADHAPAGLAGRMLVRIVRTCLQLNIQGLHLLGAGGRTWPGFGSGGHERWGGYFAWPSYGFEMPLLAKTVGMHQHFLVHPKNLANCYTVQQLLREEGGRDHWRVVGDGWFMNFDTSNPNTDSIALLLQQVAKKGV